MSAERSLIVNADDFGQSEAINRGVVRAHADGIVTSASLMVRLPTAEQAVAVAPSTLGLGLHIDLGEWALRNGRWRPLYRVVDLDDERAVRAQVARQLEQFRNLVGRDPTHLDSHQHVHFDNPFVSTALDAVATELSVPLRGRSSVRYCGAFYGQERDGSPAHDAITAERLVELVRSLPLGFTELSCHPATAHDTDSIYGLERVMELHALCAASVRSAVEAARVRLLTFAYADVPHLVPGHGRRRSGDEGG